MKKGDVLIGVSSYGDTEHWIKERCGRFVKAGCRIIVCACHNEGKTVDAVLSFRDYNPVFVSKSVGSSSQRIRLNELDGREILKLIENLILS